MKKRRMLAAAAAVVVGLLPSQARGATGDIQAVAGGSPIGDGRPATLATLSAPANVALDAAGSLYVADAGDHRVRRVDASGVITTVAGSGVAGFDGDGGPATRAALRSPDGVAVDGAGNVFVSDTGNNRVRRIDPAGVITTVAGTGLGRWSGDGTPGPLANIDAPSGVAADDAGNLYIADRGNGRIRMVDASGRMSTVAGGGSLTGAAGDGLPATQLRLEGPRGVAWAAGALYIADTGNNLIWRVDSSGTAALVAGTGLSGFAGDGGAARAAMVSAPAALAVAADGVLVADTGNHRLRKVDASGVITTIAGDGVPRFGGERVAAIGASLFKPGGVASGPDGVRIADTGNDVLRTIDASGVITITGGRLPNDGDGGAATSAHIENPTALARQSDGSLYIAEQIGRVRMVDASGVITTVAGDVANDQNLGDGGPAVEARIMQPFGLALDASGSLYIAEASGNRIRRVDRTGTITTFAGTGAEGFSGDGGPATDATLDYPTAVTLDGAGNLYVADADNARVRRIDAAGTITTVAGTGSFDFSGDGGPATLAAVGFPGALAAGADGAVYVADWSNNRVRRVAASGTITTVAGNGDDHFSGDGGRATEAGMDPSGVALDGATLYVADDRNNRIRKVDPSGTVTTIAGSGDPYTSGDGGPALHAGMSVWALATDGAAGIDSTDRLNGRIRNIDAQGIVSLVAGRGDEPPEDMGDGAAATSARLSSPEDAVTGPDGETYIADTYQYRVRRVDAHGIITTLAEMHDVADPRRPERPTSLALSADGRLYVSLTYSDAVVVVDTATGAVSPIAGTGDEGFSGDGAAATSAQVSSPRGLALDSAGNLYIADSANFRIRRVDGSGTITTVAGSGDFGYSGDDGPASQAAIGLPTGLAFDSAGSLFFTDGANHVVRMIDQSGRITTVAGNGLPPPSEYEPWPVVGDGLPATVAFLSYPWDVDVDEAGNIFVADWGDGRIRRIDAATGLIATVAGGGPGEYPRDGRTATAVWIDPVSVHIEADGDVLIADSGNFRVLRVAGPL